MDNLTRWLLLVAGLTLSLNSMAGATDDKAKPNVIIVMTDDQGIGDFSYMGNPVLKTPEMDKFAKEAVRLTDFHVMPMCSPTRGQLMTGMVGIRNGATSVTAGRTFLRPGIKTIADHLAAGGYKTGIFGKWHLGDFYPHRPIDKGFHESIYHLGWGQLMSTPEFDWPLFDGRYFRNGVQNMYDGHCTDHWFDSAIGWIKERKDANEPFFCYIPTNAPHAPHIDYEKYIKPYQGKGPAGFFGMIAHIDERFGDLERFLEKEGLKDNTIVIFKCDNGGTAGVNLFNAGLRGRKTQYYEGGHRVPCWIRWPNGDIGEPRDINVPTDNTDILPTVLELCGLPAPKWDEKDKLYHGISLAGLLKGTQKTLPDRKLVVQYGQTPEKFQACVIWNKWRLVHGDELYDVEADLAQKNNVAEQNPDVFKAMRDHYETWWAGLEPYVNEFVPISIGAEQQPIVELTSGDWEGIYADNTGFVREAVGGPTGGHWNILVEADGEYEFVLRRWPEQTGVALGDRHLPSDKSPAQRKGLRTVGFPNIAKARIELAGESAEVEADPKEKGATIRVKLPAGRTKMKAWFADAAGENLCGAFFVTVKKLGD